MSFSNWFLPSSSAAAFKLNHRCQYPPPSFPSSSLNFRPRSPSSSLHSLNFRPRSPYTTPRLHHRIPSSSDSHGDGGIDNIPPTGGGGNNNNDDRNGNNHEDGDNAENKNRAEAMMVLAEAKRSVESLPKELAAEIEAGRIPGSAVLRFLDLEKLEHFGCLMQHNGFKKQLIADDLFLAQIGIECAVGVAIGVFTATALEHFKGNENFFKELRIAFSDVVMGIIMPVDLPSPTVNLRPPLLATAGPLGNYFYSFPDNAFKIAIRGSSSSFLERSGAIAGNGSKLFAVGTASSLQPRSVDPFDVAEMSCPACPLCPLAITEAECEIPHILAHVRAVFEKVGLEYIIRMTGCPNGCARPNIVELVFVGDGTNSFQIWLGGTLDQTTIASMNTIKIRDLEKALDSLFNYRQSKESFGAFTNRMGFQKLKELVDQREGMSTSHEQRLLSCRSRTFEVER